MASSKSRTVLFGHAAYFKEDGVCIVPENTTITFYAPPGAVIDQTICAALANRELVTSQDIEPVKGDLFFLTHDLIAPAKRADVSQLGTYPKTFKAGDTVINYFINPAKLPDTKENPRNEVPTQVMVVENTMQLKDIFENLKGQDIHWAACSFAKNPHEESIGYGYAYKFKKSSPLRSLYVKESSDEQKKLDRAKRFNLSSNFFAESLPSQNIQSIPDSYDRSSSSRQEVKDERRSRTTPYGRT